MRTRLLFPMYIRLLFPTKYMGMIEQRLVAIVASYKIKLGIPFSPTWTVSGASSAVAAAAVRFDFPTVTDLDNDPADGDTDPDFSTANTSGVPLSIVDIRAQVESRAERMKAAGPNQFTGDNVSPVGVKTARQMAASTRMPPQT